MDCFVDIRWPLVKQRIKQRVMTTLRQMVLEEAVRHRKGNPNFEISLRNSLKNEGITDESKINRILANIDTDITNEILKQDGERFLALIPKLVADETQKICEEIACMLKEAGTEAGNELIAELSSTT